MGIPVILATAAACGSLVTTMKSGWELSRMIRQKRDQMQAEEDAVRVYRGLRRALNSGRMSDREYDHWFERFLVAESEKNLNGLRKIRAHLRILNDNSEKRSHRHSSSRGSSDASKSSSSSSTRSSSRQPHRRHEDDTRRRRQQSVRFDTRQTYYYVPDPPQQQQQRYQDVEWPQSAGSIEYFPLKDRFPTLGEKNDATKKQHQQPVRLARLQRRTSVSYQPAAESPPKPSRSGRSESPARRGEERGRSRRREARGARARVDTDSSDEYYHEKLGYRSRR